MNRKQVVASLRNIADNLDSNGLYQEANEVTNVMMRISQFEGALAGGYGALQGSKVKGKFPYNPSGGPSFPKNPYAKDSDLPESEPEPRNIEVPFNPSGGMVYPPRDINTPKPPKKPSVQTIPIEGQPDPAPLGPRKRPIFEDFPPPVPKPDGPKTKPDGPKTKPSTKPGEVGKKPTSPSDAPTSVEGLDRWVNKAENIYSQWVLKGANPGSTAHLLIKDIVDYMQKVKGNLPTSLHSAADAKISQVQKMMQSAKDGIPMAKYPMPYSLTTGYQQKGDNPFEEGRRLPGKKLDYQAKQESKSY